MKTFRSKYLTAGAMLAFSPLLAGGISTMASAETSLKGKTITIIINSKPGGGTDGNARLVGSNMADHLPGKPTVVFRNLPGGGGIKANNYFYNRVKPDGTTLLVGSRTQISPTKLRHKAAKYNPGEYRYVGGTIRLGTLVLIRKEQLPRLNDPAARPLAFGGIDGERSGTAMAAWAKEFLGWNIKFVLGYPGATDMIMSARRGESDMIANQNVYNVGPLLKEGMIALAQFGQRDDNGKMIPRTAFPKVPVFDDMIRPKLKGAALKAYQTWMDDQLVDKWMALPPKTPDAYVEVYRKAYAAVMKDRKFMDIAKREFGEDFEAYPGKTMDKIAQDLAATPTEDLAYFLNLRKKLGLPSGEKKSRKKKKKQN
jgi:hypothetical protein